GCSPCSVTGACTSRRWRRRWRSGSITIGTNWWGVLQQPMKAPEIHFASYYRWLVATQYWQLPLHFDTPVLDIGADDGGFLARVQAPLKVALDLAPPRARLPFARLQ